MQFRLQPMEHAWLANSLSWQGEPRTDTERTDFIMRRLAMDPIQPVASEYSQTDTSFPMRWPDFGLAFASNPDYADMINPGLAQVTGYSRMARQPIQLASVAAAIPAGIQIGQVGIAALRTLGPLAAATLTAILKCFHDTLGRQPTPAELDKALAGEGQEQGSTVSRDRPGAPPDKQECEDQLKIEEAICSEVAKKYNKEAGAVCQKTAMERYSECLHFGPSGVRTPLYRP